MLQTIVSIQSWFAARSSDERGATAVEYGLMVALIAVAIIIAVSLLGDNLSTLFDSTADEVSKNTPAPAAP
jgi:pilus assembly protein Flp/PilA